MPSEAVSDDLETAMRLKNEGNALFAAENMTGAVESYSGALAALVTGANPAATAAAPVADDLRATLLTNRAAAHIKLGDTRACESDCSAALLVDPGRAKALFRRAQAREALGCDADALRDLKRLLELEPGNKPAAAAARRVKDKVAAQAAENSPLRQALRAVAAAAAALPAADGTAPASEPAAKATVAAAAGPLPTPAEALRALGAMAAKDASAAAAMLREGGVAAALRIAVAGAGSPTAAEGDAATGPGGGEKAAVAATSAKAAPAAAISAKAAPAETADAAVRVEALRALSAAASHRICGLPLLHGAAEHSGPLSVEQLAAVVDGGDGAVASAALALLVHVLQWDDTNFVARVAPPLDPEGDAAYTAAAAAAFAKAAAAAAAAEAAAEKEAAANGAADDVAAADADDAAAAATAGPGSEAVAAAGGAANKKKKKPAVFKPPTPEALEEQRYRRRWLPFLWPVAAAFRVGLQHPDPAVRDTAMEALVCWCSGTAASGGGSGAGTGAGGAGAEAAADEAMTPQTSTLEQRRDAFRRRTRRSLLARDKALVFCGGFFAGSGAPLPPLAGYATSGTPAAAAAADARGGALMCLYRLLDSEAAPERRKAAAAVSRLIRAAAAVQAASDAERDADRQAAEAVLAPLLVFVTADGDGADANSSGGGIIGGGGTFSGESRLSAAVRRVALAAAVAAADPNVGAWALAQPGCVATAVALAGTGDMVAHEAAAEALCAAAGIEGGRPLLAPAVESGALFALMESRSGAARAAAASAYAKLGMLSRALTAGSDDVTKLLNVALDLLSDTGGAGTGGGSGGTGGAGGFDPDTLAERERAVEVLSFLVSKTRVKEELCYGSARCVPALPRLCRAALDAAEGSKPPAAAVKPAISTAAKPGTGAAGDTKKKSGGSGGSTAVAYGLAFVLSAVSVSAEEDKKESFRDKDMSYEQYQQLQKLAEAHGKGAKEDDSDKPDTHEAALRRCRALVDAGAVPALRAIATGGGSGVSGGSGGAGGHGSEAARLAVATCFRRLATDVSVRGALVQQGALTFLVNLAADPTASDRCRGEARHAVAKTLVSVNPALLSDAQRLGAIVPLMALCRRPDSEGTDLERFEALLALTNLASSGDAARDRIAADSGLRALAYLQFSEHEMVRRAATECLGNLLPNEAFLSHLAGHETMRLWVAFAGLATPATATATAAASAAANGDGDGDGDGSGDARGGGVPSAEDMATAVAAAGCLAMAVQAEEVATAFLGCKGAELLVELLQSGDPNFYHRAAVAALNLAEQKPAMAALAKAGVPAALRAAAKRCPAKSPAKEAIKQALGAVAEE